MSNVNNKNDAHSLFNRGLELLQTGNPAQAATILEQVRELEPNKASVLEALGRAYMGYGRHRKALDLFNTIITNNPTEHFAHYCMGLCLKRLGQLSKAALHMRMAVSMHKSDEYTRALLNLEQVAKIKRKERGSYGSS